MAEKCFTRMGQIGIAVKDIKAAGEMCKKYGICWAMPMTSATSRPLPEAQWMWS